MLLFIGIDDTDNKESRGTGHLARTIAQHPALESQVLGVTRHQLFYDPRVPYTAKNSCATILLNFPVKPDIEQIYQTVRQIMLSDFQPGSDPGLCVADRVSSEIITFAKKAKMDLVNQQEARALASQNGLILEGLGGTEDGVIGALSAVGLAFDGNDGRYVQVGENRSLSGVQNIETILASGISSVQTLDGNELTSGDVLADKLRPARRNKLPVLFVEPGEEYWLPLKVD